MALNLNGLGSGDGSGPIFHADQTMSHRSSIFRLIILLPASVLVSAPVVALAYRVAREPGTVEALAARPLAASTVLIGLVIWLLVFVLPTFAALGRLWSGRVVEIREGRVSVDERGPWRRRRWSESLEAYRGIAHHVKASILGLNHELILVHPDPARNIVLAAGEVVPQSLLEEAKARFGMPEVPARAIYETRRAIRRRSAPVGKVTTPASA